MSEFIKVGAKNDFADRKPTGVQVSGQSICIIRLGDRFYAIDDRCTHAQVQLSAGDVEEDNELVCPLHGARFSVETGEALTPPAVKPVKTHEVKVEGDAIFVKLK
jgi:3-phenylpropionate/trans-cinnamate dioxygenase ferredoxin subunit